MKWSRQRVDATSERNIVIGMVTSDQFMREIAPLYRPELMEVPFARTVAEWCMGHFRRYGKAPQATIQDIFDAANGKRQLDEAEAKLISAFLLSLSEEHEQSKRFNAPYALDQAELYFRARAAQLLAKEINSSLSMGSVEETEALIAAYRRPARGVSKGVDILRDTDAMREAFSETEHLIELPGALGRRVGPLGRGDFLAVLAPGKRGKSWMLEFIGLRGMFAGINVAWFSLEMSQKQIMRRLAQTFLGEPNRAREVVIPEFDCQLNRDNACGMTERACSVGYGRRGYRRCVACYGGGGQSDRYAECISHRTVQKPGVSSKRAVEKQLALQKIVRSGRFHLITYPARSVTVDHLATCLDNLEYYDGFTADMIVVDYATILDSSLRGDYRQKLNDKWELLRGLGQEKHVLMVTAHHSNKQTFDRKIRQGDQKEDSRLIDHVTTMLSLNQTPEEKRDGVMQVGVLAQRFDDFDLTRETTVLQCLAIGKPYLDSH